MAESGVWKTLQNPNFEEILIFEGCGGSRMTKMHSGGVQNIFEKFLNFFILSPLLDLAISAQKIEIFMPTRALNGQIRCMENGENPKFEDILFFEGRSGARMPRMYSWKV